MQIDIAKLKYQTRIKYKLTCNPTIFVGLIVDNVLKGTQAYGYSVLVRQEASDSLFNVFLDNIIEILEYSHE